MLGVFCNSYKGSEKYWNMQIKKEFQSGMDKVYNHRNHYKTKRQHASIRNFLTRHPYLNSCVYALKLISVHQH